VRRLSPAMLTMMMLGVVGLLVAMYFGKRLLATQELPPPDPVVNVPMALTDLRPGTRITEAHIGQGRARESGLTRDIIRSNRVVIGRVVKNPITAAEPISTTDLYPPGESPPLEVAEGMRAVTIPVGEATAAVSGLVQVGQYVDIHFTPSGIPGDDDTGGLIMTLFKGVKILAINGIAVGGTSAGRGASNVTLELTPQQANIILLARDRGVLNLTYTPDGKGTGVIAVEDENRATLNEILNLAPRPEPEPPFVTEFFEGTSRGVYQFRDGMRIGDGFQDPQDDRLRSPGSNRRQRGRDRETPRDRTVPEPDTPSPPTDDPGGRTARR
jgi:pilus assembly protein CpaB